MNTNTVIIIGIVLLALITTAITFYNTIITKRWGNQVPNEEECWKWGFIYYNSMDSRIILPKRTGLGYTLNFAKPISIFLIIGIILLISVVIIIVAK